MPLLRVICWAIIFLTRIRFPPGVSIADMKLIYLLQKRAVIAMTNSDYCVHSSPLFKKLNILDIFKLNTQLYRYIYVYL
jgi:hypothetical protein